MATQTNIVFVNDVRAVKGASNSTLTDGQWFWVSGVCYLRSDAGNPDTLGSVVEAGQRSAAIDTNSQNGFSIINVCAQRSNASESGIYCHFQPANYLIDGCTVQDHYGVGIHINGTTSTTGTIQNSIIANNGIYGIWHSHPQCLLQNVLNNTIYGNAWRTDGTADFAGGWNGQVQSGVIAFNTIYNNGAGSTLSTGTAHGIYLNVDVTNCTLLIHDNICYGHTKGNGIKADSSCTIYNNVSHDNAWQGMELGFNTANSIVITAHHNTCYNNGRGGLSIQHGSSGTGTLTVNGYHNTFYQNCTISGNEVDLISNFAAFDWRNNIVVGAAGKNLIRTSVNFTGTATVDNNCWAGGSSTPFRWNGGTATFAQYQTATGFDSHGQNVDPKFQSPSTASFLLQQVSPCINAGIAITGINDGFSGTAPDQGANEFVGAPPVVQDLLLQKADGTYYLLLWNRATSWNAGTRQDIANAPVTVTVSFPATHTVTQYTPSSGTGGTFLATASSVSVSVPDELILLHIT